MLFVGRRKNVGQLGSDVLGEQYCVYPAIVSGDTCAFHSYRHDVNEASLGLNADC